MYKYTVTETFNTVLNGGNKGTIHCSEMYIETELLVSVFS